MALGMLPIVNWVLLAIYVATLIGVAVVYGTHPKALSSIPLYLEKRIRSKDFFCEVRKRKKKSCNTCNDDCDDACTSGNCSSVTTCNACIPPVTQDVCDTCGKRDSDCSCDKDESSGGSDNDNDNDCGGCGRKSCNQCSRKKKVHCRPPQNVSKGQFFIWPIIFVVLSLLVLYHLLCAISTSKHSWYVKETTLIGNNPVRWLGYVLIAGLILPVIAATVGYRNQNSLLVLVAAVIGEAAFHLFAERTLVHAKRPLYAPDWCMVVVAFVVGIAAFILIWVALIRTLKRNTKACATDCNGKAPTWILVVFWTWFAVGVTYWVLLIVLACCPGTYYCWYEIAFCLLGLIDVLVFVIATTIGLVSCIKRTKCWLPFLSRCEECC